MNFDGENLILTFRSDDKVVFEIFRVSGPEAGEQAAQQITCGAANPYRSRHFCPYGMCIVMERTVFMARVSA
jgi:hypothetical protein